MEWERIVGANVRRFRKEAGLSQERLALSAGIDLRYLGGIERGEHNPSVAVLGRLAEALEVHPSAFFDEDALDADESD
jgi:transcriptional regulator with XRE-family HTH domain